MAAPSRFPADEIMEVDTEPWDEDRYLALPESRRRVELLDGALLMSPNPATPHQRLSSRLCWVLERARPDHLETLEAVNVRVGPGKILIPDLVVVDTPGADHVVWDAAQVRMAVEILGPNAGPVDRAVKPGLYAAAGIGHYLRIVLRPGGPDAAAYRLERGGYVDAVRAAAGEDLLLTDPVAVAVDLAALLAAPRPPR